MLLGVFSVVVGVAEPQRSGIQTGFIVSTVGILAIVVGVHAVKVARWSSSATRAFGRGGAVLGGVGTALMAYALIGVALSGTGVQLPALSLPSTEYRSELDTVALPTPDATPTPTPAPAPASAPADAEGSVPNVVTENVPTTVDIERAGVVQSAGTLAYVMKQSFGAGPYPATLTVGMAAPERILLLDGTPLAPIPDGARVLYSAAPDGSSWSVTIIGARFGAVATFSSTVGTVQAG
ncbi:hypothetical protein [Curtobacterium sp. PhB115]|uniref:hypothetical protein n=1 Tax=Curtobacterium sp. PhB115 TaxID=2485173 RepID=UPI000F4C329C|nr:hypothetical protein [Curtobacterium sp. PhB115]ROP64107.1 hypothetical protein EDF19_3052 [Curtobacterium sp. PhB115]